MKFLVLITILCGSGLANAQTSTQLKGKPAQGLMTALMNAGAVVVSQMETSQLEVKDLHCSAGFSTPRGHQSRCTFELVSGSKISVRDLSAQDLILSLSTAGVKSEHSYETSYFSFSSVKCRAGSSPRYTICKLIQ